MCTHWRKTTFLLMYIIYTNPSNNTSFYNHVSLYMVWKVDPQDLKGCIKGVLTMIVDYKICKRLGYSIALQCNYTYHALWNICSICKVKSYHCGSMWTYDLTTTSRFMVDLKMVNVLVTMTFMIETNLYENYIQWKKEFLMTSCTITEVVFFYKCWKHNIFAIIFFSYT